MKTKTQREWFIIWLWGGLLFCITIVLASCSVASEGRGGEATLTAVAVSRATEILATPTLPPPTATLTPTATPMPTATRTPVPTVTPTPLPTGERALSRGAVPQRLIAVMLDNHPDAYPQTGMDHAVLVFEALAEYGITRYMAVFAPGISPRAEVIGPVRSARDYFVQWAIGLQAVYAHAGGSPDGLWLAASASEIANMDALEGYAEAYFYRSSARFAPHNLYTDSDLLERFVADKGAESFDPSEQGFLFKYDAPPDARPTSQQLSYYFLYAEDPAGWVYDPQTNGYYRLRRGKPHTDGRTGEQLWFKNVIILEVMEAPIPGDPKQRIRQEVVGEGIARIFVDGKAQEARWSKPYPATPLRFYGPDDQEILLNAGPVWIAAIPSMKNLTVRE